MVTIIFRLWCDLSARSLHVCSCELSVVTPLWIHGCLFDLNPLSSLSASVSTSRFSSSMHRGGLFLLNSEFLFSSSLLLLLSSSRRAVRFLIRRIILEKRLTRASLLFSTDLPLLVSRLLLLRMCSVSPLLLSDILFSYPLFFGEFPQQRISRTWIFSCRRSLSIPICSRFITR